MAETKSQEKYRKEKIHLISVRKSTAIKWKAFREKYLLSNVDAATAALEQYMAAQESGEAQKLRESICK
jgi:hypothetical protein